MDPITSIQVLICVVLCAIGGYFIIDKIVKSVKGAVTAPNATIISSIVAISKDEAILKIFKEYTDGVNIAQFDTVDAYMNHLRIHTEKLIREEILNRYPDMVSIMTEENVHAVFDLLLMAINYTDDKIKDLFNKSIEKQIETTDEEVKNEE